MRDFPGRIRTAALREARSFPTICPHCAEAGRTPKYVYDPPAYVRVLHALRSGVKGDRTNTVGTKAQIAQRLGISAQRTAKLVDEAFNHGLLSMPYGVGTGIYRKSHRGAVLLQAWVHAGWDPENGRVSQESARGR